MTALPSDPQSLTEFSTHLLMSDPFTLPGLFLSALLSSTLLPGGSEAVLLWLDQQTNHPDSTLLWVATAGNTLGGISTWAVGWLIARRWGPEQQRKRLDPRAVRWIEQHGSPILLLSWLPVVGDGLCLAAGWFRMPLPAVTLFIAAGKAARYGVLLWVV